MACLLLANQHVYSRLYDRQHHKSGSTSIRFLNLDFIMSKDENAVSHRYADGKGIKSFNAI